MIKRKNPKEKEHEDLHTFLGWKAYPIYNDIKVAFETNRKTNLTISQLNQAREALNLIKEGSNYKYTDCQPYFKKASKILEKIYDNLCKKQKLNRDPIILIPVKNSIKRKNIEVITLTQLRELIGNENEIDNIYEKIFNQPKYFYTDNETYEALAKGINFVKLLEEETNISKETLNRIKKELNSNTFIDLDPES